MTLFMWEDPWGINVVQDPSAACHMQGQSMGPVSGVQLTGLYLCQVLRGVVGVATILKGLFP